MPGVVDVLIRGARREIQHVIDFATTPVGPFETVDKMVKTARQTVRDVASEVGVRIPFRGQVIPIRPIERLRERIRVRRLLPPV